VLTGRLLGGAERIGRLRWAGLLVGLAGVALLAAPGLGGGEAWPIAEMVLVVLGYATGPIVLSRYLADVPSMVSMAVCLSVAAVVYLPFAVLTWPASLPSMPALASLGTLALVCTALAFVAFSALIKEVGPDRAMVFTYVNPAIAVVAGVLLLHEPLTWAIASSFGLILIGSVLATVSWRVKVRNRDLCQLEG